MPPRIRPGTRALVIAGAFAVLAGCTTSTSGVNGAVAGGALAGGALGGLAGSQIGDGRGQLAATAAGAGLGALLGAEAGRRLDAADRTPDPDVRSAPAPYVRDPYDARPGADPYVAYDRRYDRDPWRADARGYERETGADRRARARYRPRRAVGLSPPRPVADPTRQVPIPGAKVPGGGLAALLPDLGPPPVIRNVAVPADPAADPACSPVDQPTLKPAYSCQIDGVSFVVQ